MADNVTADDVWLLECDSCQTRLPVHPASTEAQARRKAVDFGWQAVPGGDWCPACVADADEGR